MKLFSSLAVIGGLLAGIGFMRPAQAQPSPAQDAYQKYFQAWQEYQNALYIQENASGYLKTLTPDHVTIDLKGHKSTFREEKRNLGSTFKNISAMDIKSQVGNVQVKGNIATAMVASGVAATVWNRLLQMDLNMTGQTIELKTFRLTKGKWYESSSREVQVRVWLEGREIPYSMLRKK